MKRTRAILIIIALVSFLGGNTQSPAIDSVNKVIQEQKEDSNKVKSLLDLSYLFWDQEDYTKAMQNAQEALALSRKINYRQGEANAHDNISVVYTSRMNFAEMTQHMLAALAIQQELGDKMGISNMLHSLGAGNQYLNNNEEALRYYGQALQMKKEIGDTAGIALAYDCIGGIYCLQNKLSEALQMHQTAMRLYKTMDSVYVNQPIANIHENIGAVYEKQGDSALAAGNKIFAMKKYYDAIKKNEEALKIWMDENDQRNTAQKYLYIGNIYRKLGKLAEARAYLNKGLNISLTISKIYNLRDGYLYLSILDSVQGNFSQAYTHYKYHIRYRDSLLNEETIRKTEGYKMQYAFDKKEAEIKLLTTENELKTALASKENQRKNFAYAGIGLLVLLGSYGFYYYRRKKQLQNKQALLNERLRISRELHDEVGATLSGISMYSHLAKSQVKEQQREAAEKSLNIMQQSSGEMVNKLNDIVWLINPEQDSLQKLIEKLEEYAKNMASVKNMQVKITTPARLEESTLPMESRRNVYLFCKEAINNAVKYSDGSLIELIIKKTGNKLEFSVSDNGKGFDSVMVKRGNGLENMQKRADDINAKLVIESKQNEGSLVSIQIQAI